MDTKDSLTDELVGVVDALKTALHWWQQEAQYLTMGDPEWVSMAHRAIDKVYPPVPVPAIADGTGNRVLLKTQLVHLTQGDVDVLRGSRSRKVRIDPYEDKSVKELYKIWISL